MFDFIQTIDFYIILQIYRAGGNPILDQAAVILSFLGTVRFGAIILSILFWMKKETRPITIVLLSAVLLSGGLTWIIKEIVDRPRPYIELGLTAADMLIQTDPTVSFPSGHATTAFATASVVSYYFRKWAVPAFLLAGIMGLSRIYLLVHYPSDVLAGAAVGILSAAFVIYWYARYRRKTEAGFSEKTEADAQAFNN